MTQNLSSQAQKFLISMKKGFIGRPLSMLVSKRFCGIYSCSCILGLNHLLRSFRDRIHELFWFMCRIHMEYKGSLIIEGISDHHFFCSSNTCLQTAILFIFTRKSKMLHFYILLFTTCKLLDFYPEIFDEMPPCHWVHQLFCWNHARNWQRLTKWGQFFLDFTEQIALVLTYFLKLWVHTV